MTNVRTISLKAKHDAWITAQGHQFNLSQFVQAKLDEEIAKTGGK